MKNLITVLLLVSLVACTTNGVYDPQKTERLQIHLKPIVSALVRAGAKKPDEKVYIAAVGDVFCKMKETTNFSTAYLSTEINKIVTPAVQNPFIFLVKDELVAIYEDNFSQTYPLATNKWPAFISVVFCDGIRNGLINTNAGGGQ